MIEAVQISCSSLRCNEAVGGTLVASSRELGWTSLLLDRFSLVPDNEIFETGSTPDQSIVIMLRGQQQLSAFSGGIWRRATYHPGTAGLTPGGATDRLRRRVTGRNPAPFEKVNLYIPTRFFEDAAEEFRSAGQRSCASGLNSLAHSDPMLMQVSLALLKAIKAGAPNLYASTTASWLAVHLLSTHAGGIDPFRLGTGVITDRRLSRVLEMISARFAEPLDLAQIAAEAGISKFHFVRVFRERVGLTPHALLIELRLDAARTMLVSTDLDIATIALRCGYATASQLTTSFTRKFGKPPAQWRVSFRN